MDDFGSVTGGWQSGIRATDLMETPMTPTTSMSFKGEAHRFPDRDDRTYTASGIGATNSSYDPNQSDGETIADLALDAVFGGLFGLPSISHAVGAAKFSGERGRDLDARRRDTPPPQQEPKPSFF